LAHDALAGGDGALEEAVEHGAGAAEAVGGVVGFADLAEDLGFAEDH